MKIISIVVALGISLGIGFHAAQAMDSPEDKEISHVTALYKNVWDLADTDPTKLDSLITRETKEISQVLGNLGKEIYFSVVSVSLPKTETKRIDADIYSSDADKGNIGSIQIYVMNSTDSPMTGALMGKGNEKVVQEISSKYSPSPKFGYLAGIEIYDQYKSQGYGAIALKTFNTLMDKIDVCCTFLTVNSEKPYAASIYVKGGYKFSPKTIKEIKDWAEKECSIINSPENTEKAEQEFLGDSRRIKNPMMIRWKK